MKRFFGTFFIISLFFTLTVCLSVGVSADDLTDDGLWSYALNGENAELTAYHGSAADIYVPSKISVNQTEYAVTKLGDGAFKNNDTVNSVTLGEGIKEIGAEAFYDCDSLVCIVISENVLSIGNKAFYSCDFFNSVILYNGINSIDADAFAECPKLVFYCNEGTVGYNYAVENDISYVVLGQSATPETVIIDNVQYLISEGAVTVMFCTNKNLSGEVTIPSEVKVILLLMSIRTHSIPVNI